MWTRWRCPDLSQNLLEVSLQSLVVLVMRLTISPEAAVIMDLQDRDGTVREYVATFPLEAISGHRAHQGGEMPPHDKLVSG
jgi:hypothetical protein